MNSCLTILALVFIISLLILVRKKIINEKFIIGWILLGLLVILSCIFDRKVFIIEERIKAFFPQYIILLIIVCVLVIYSIYSFIQITKQAKLISRLEQEISLLKSDKKNEEGKH